MAAIKGVDATIFVLTVDTEADNQWNHGIPVRTKNMRFLGSFQRLCLQHGVAPTYLVTSEIATDKAAQSLLGSWVQRGEAEVGAHLHPWTTPPFREEPGLRFNDASHPFMSELPEDLATDKLENLTNEIQKKIGVRPTAFRAGRYGLGPSSAAILANFGYLVDSSVTPMIGWSLHPGLPGGGGGPDFSAHTTRPFIVDGTGKPGLLEIPITIAPTHTMLRRFPDLLELYDSSPMRAVRKISRGRLVRSQPVWLHPAHFENSLADLQHLFSQQAKLSGVAVMMLHSSELMPAGSPRTPDEGSARKVLHRLDGFLNFIRSKEVVSMTLSGAASAIRSQQRLEVRPL